MKRLRFPLYLKVLSCLGLNLVLGLIVLWAFFPTQFQTGSDSMLVQQAGKRLEAAAELIRFDLERQPESEWNSVLARFSDAYGVRFSLFRGNGVYVAGADKEAPAEVLAQLREARLRPGFGADPRRGRPERGREGERPPGPPRSARPGGPEVWPRFFVKTEVPRRYWLGIQVPPPRPERAQPGRPPGRPGPLLILASAESLAGNGLFFDIGPLVLAGASLLVLSALLWFPFVRGMTGSIARMTAATQRVAEGDFSDRIATRRRDELGALALAINSMTDRLESFTRGQRRFLGDVAHELCSPIARIQLVVGLLEQRGDQPERLAQLQEEVNGMSSLVDELLSFSKASYDPGKVQLQSVSLRPLIGQIVAREGAGATIDVSGEDVAVMADPTLLGRSLGNLLRNAVRYAGAAGTIEIHTSRNSGMAVVSVRDHGSGIPEEQLHRIFDPFHRVEPARDRESGGVGLGLAIVKTCVEACRGSVRAENCDPSGLRVELTLKLSPQ